jgi:hypothetical protein
MINQFAQFYAMLNAAPVSDKDELKATLVSRATGGRTIHLHDMSPSEYTDLLKSMQSVKRECREDKSLKKWRHVCLSLMRDYGVQVDNWAAINAFCANPRIAGVEFRQLDETSLKKLSVKIRALITKNGGAYGI